MNIPSYLELCDSTCFGYKEVHFVKSVKKCFRMRTVYSQLLPGKYIVDIMVCFKLHFVDHEGASLNL